MNKSISQFRIEADGFFIDQAEQNGRIGVDPESGNIYLDEGDGPDRFHGAVIGAGDFRELKFDPSAGGRSGHVILGFGEKQSHDLGVTTDMEAAVAWTSAATKAIRASRDRSVLNRAELARVRE